MNDRPRQIEVIITLTSSDSFKLIKEDIETELRYCWHTFEEIEIKERRTKTKPSEHLIKCVEDIKGRLSKI